MILQKDIGGNIRYMLGDDTPPSAIAYTVVDSTDTVRQTGTIATMPTLYVVAETTVQGDGLDVRLDITLGAGQRIASAIKPGELLRVADSEGRVHDLVCSGRGASHLLVSGLTLGPDESCASVWMPEVDIPVAAATCHTAADGYRVQLTITGGTTSRDVVYFAVAPYSLLVPLNVRTFLDWHPEYGSHQAALIRRRDWPRLVQAAITLLETKLKASGTWLQLVASPMGLQRAAAAALYYLIGEEFRPQDWSGALGDFERSRARRLDAAIQDLLSSSKVDSDADGSVATSQREPAAPFVRFRL